MSIAEQRKADFQKSLEFLQQELSGLRTGRANPSMVEHIVVDAYGVPTPLVQLASITTPEATQLLIQPWDPNVVKSVEKAIQASPLGINPTVDATGIRLAFPPLTQERRQELMKVVREKAEMARVSVRAIREDIHKQLKQAEKDGALSEDQVEQETKSLQAIVETFNEHIAQVVEKKNTELSTM